MIAATKLQGGKMRNSRFDLTESSLSPATIRFLPSWCQHQEGEINPSGRLIIEYFPERLAALRKSRRDWTPWIITYVRFHPSGQLHIQDIFITYQQTPARFEVSVPLDAEKVEIWWFHPEPIDGGTWDSQFGRNYWYSVVPKRREHPFIVNEPIPEDSINYRSGVTPSLEMVNVFDETPPQTRPYYTGTHAGPPGSSLCTRLFVKTWVKNVAYLKNVWLDIYIFGFKEQPLSAKTYIMHYLEPAGGNGDFFILDDEIYTERFYVPGAFESIPQDREVRYRLYFEVNGTVYTDGVLHKHDVQKLY